MANVIPSELIPRIYAGAIDVLRESNEFIQSIKTDFSPDVKTKGDHITFNASTSQSVVDVTPSNTAPALVDSTLQYKTVPMNYWKASRFSLNTQDISKIVTQNWTPPQMEECIRSIGNFMNTTAFNVADANTNMYAGTASANIFATDLAYLGTAKTLLDNAPCPKANRFAVIGSAEYNKALTLSNMYALNIGDNAAVRGGVLNNLFNFNTQLDQGRINHVSGTGTLYVFNGAVTAGNTVIAVKTGTGTILPGDIVTLQSDTTQYVVQASTGLDPETSITVYPALSKNHADGDTVTVFSHGTNYGVGFAGDKGALGLAVRSTENELDGAGMIGESMLMTDPVSKMPMTVTWIPNFKAITVEVSVLFGAGMLDPRRLCKLITVHD